MTLSEALVLMAPPDPMLPAVESDRREAAIERVYYALSGLLTRARIRHEYRDDVLNDAIKRLMKNRPGPRRFTSTDAEAEAYLIRALKNHQLDYLRRKQQELVTHTSLTASSDDERRPLDVADAGPSIEATLQGEQDDTLRRDVAEAAVDVLYDRALPAIATTLQQPDGFLETAADLRRIALDGLEVDVIVEREGGSGPSFKRVRDRVYQRHKRTRAYLLESPRNRPHDVPRLSRWLADSGLTPDMQDAVRRAAHHIFAPRVIRQGAGSAQDGAV